MAIPLRQIAKRFLERMGKITPTVPPPNFSFTSAATSCTEA
ncbi:hypothetical protein EVA_12374 [gut metagenome]|uniref:Uncharacterized protein n=1 Tax=gut metagenome TaxID=749906 RepID=J9CHG5_9ZZZZ